MRPKRSIFLLGPKEWQFFSTFDTFASKFVPFCENEISLQLCGILNDQKIKLNGVNIRFNPSSSKGGCTNPPNGFRPGAQNRTAKG